MSKVICDVCGTTYPETANQCPICGCARNTTNQTTAGADGADGSTYAPIKGGRFSKSNVRKRSQGAPTERRAPAQKDEENEGANKILVAIVVVLLLAIVAVVIYIGVKFLAGIGGLELPGDTGSSQVGETEPSETEPLEIKCQSITIAGLPEGEPVELVEEGKKWMLAIEKLPAETTDPLIFVSSDPAIATVDENGTITAVGGGTCTITVTCGSQSLTCTVVCSFGEVVPPTTTVPPVTIPEGFVLKLYKGAYNGDFTFYKEGDSVNLFTKAMRDMGVEPSDITWVVENTEVAKVVDGKVIALDRGTTKVHAIYGDQTDSVIIRCSFDKAEPSKYHLSDRDNDITVYEGDAFTLYLVDSEGANVAVEWMVSEEGFLEIDGNKFKAIAHTQDVSGRYIKVSCTIEDETHECVIRIYPKPEPTETTAPGA